MDFLNSITATDGTRFPLPDRRETLIGRDGMCDVVLPFGSISRRHARLFREEDHWIIEDLNSINGTFVNGKRVEGRTPLKCGDRINIYHVGFRLASEEDESRTSAAVSSPPVSPSLFQTASDDTMILGDVPNSPVVAPVAIERAQLRAITEINRQLSDSFDLSVVLPRVLDLLFESCPATASGQILLADATGRLVPQALKHGRDDAHEVSEMCPFDHAVLTEVMQSAKISVATMPDSNDVMDERLSSAIAAPVIGPSNHCRGVICLQLVQADPSTIDLEVDFVQAVAAAVGQAVEHAQAHRRVLEVERQQHQLTAARDVQLQMLPLSHPEIPNYHIADYYAAADNVGGDFYDYIRLQDGRLMITIGDVAGKGFPAAMRMAQLTAESRHCMLEADSVKSAMRRLNQTCYRQEMGFITFAFVLLCPFRHEVTVANAGHLPPLLKRHRTGEVKQLWSERGGFPFGIVADQEFHPTTWSIEPGDLLLLYTDGLIEAMNPHDELFGFHRTLSCLAQESESPHLLLKRLNDDVTLFRQQRSPNDDICLISLMRMLGD